MPTRSLNALALATLLITIAAPPAIAQGTPDGGTPANEGVCDDLQYATPGLYGLCVAYCEAQDCDPLVIPDNEPPSCQASDRKLLDLYNGLKRPADPPMPCVQVTCPCWTLEELESIDADQCLSRQTVFFFRTRILDFDPIHMARTLEFPTGSLQCSYFDRRDPDNIIERIFRILPGEQQLCKDQILNRCDELGIPVGM